MKFLHTSDWHIGRQFHHVSLLEDQRHALQQLVAYALAEQVDAVLIAGDLYDRAIPPVEAINLVDETLHTLSIEHNIPVILIAGNHDSHERLGFGARQLAHSKLHIIGFQPDGPQPVLLDDPHGTVAIYGLPYSDPVLIRDVYRCSVSSHDAAIALLCQQIQQHASAQQHPRTVVLSHCFIGGSTLSDSERPLSVGGSEQVAASHFLPFSYSALGHLHAPQRRDADHIRYSGSLLKYSFSESSQHKSVTLVEMDANGACQIRLLPLQALRDVRVISGSLTALIEASAHDPQADDYLLARLSDTSALLDPMNRLRAVYPNILALERTGLMAQQQARPNPLLNRPGHSTLAMFSDFYQQLQGEPLDNKQKALLEQILDASGTASVATGANTMADTTAVSTPTHSQASASEANSTEFNP